VSPFCSLFTLFFDRSRRPVEALRFSPVPIPTWRSFLSLRFPLLRNSARSLRLIDGLHL